MSCGCNQSGPVGSSFLMTGGGRRGKRTKSMFKSRNKKIGKRKKRNTRRKGGMFSTPIVPANFNYSTGNQYYT